MSFLRKGILVSAARVVGILLSMVVGIIFSRKLGPDGMGQYMLFVAVGTTAMTLATLGVGSASIYFLNNRKVPLEAIAANSAKFGLFQGLVLCAGLTAAVLLLPGYFGRVSVAVAIFYAACVGFNTIRSILREILVAQLAVRRIVAVDLLARVVVLVLGAAMAMFGWLNAEVAIVVFALGFFGSFLLVAFYLRPHIQLSRRFDWKLFRQVLGYGVKLGAMHILTVLLYNVTIVLLRYLTRPDFAAVGLYSRAAAICGMVTLVPFAIGPLLHAKWAGADAPARKSQGEMAIRLNIGYGLLSAGAIMLLGRHIIFLLYGREFLGAQPAVLILAPGLVFLTISVVCTNLLVSDGRAGTVAWMLLGTLGIVAVVTYLAVPTLGMRGAALGVLCGNAFTALTSGLVCLRRYHLNPLRCALITAGDLKYVWQSLLGRAGTSESELADPAEAEENM